MEFSEGSPDFKQSHKRFKISEDEEVEVDADSEIFPQQVSPFELDDSNSVKLKKGNLVVRKYKDKTDELFDMQKEQGYMLLSTESSYSKSVKYLPDSDIEAVKFFQKDAKPNAPALTIAEVQKIQHEINNQSLENSKSNQQFSNEQQQVDGINKDKKRVLETIKKVSQPTFNNSTEGGTKGI
jgi:hypothetical protein